MTATLPRPRAGEPADDTGVENPLTTKDGWRRFVDKQPDPPALHSDAMLAGLSLTQRVGYDEMRIEYHADLPLVNTPAFQPRVRL